MKKKVLFLCTQNSARSQMAEGLLRHRAGDRFEVLSAGTHPSAVHPYAIEVLREIGIDLSGHQSKSVDGFLGERFDYVITVCDQARESCPVFPGPAATLHWSLEDPAKAQGTASERQAVFRRIRDDLAKRIGAFLQEQ